MNDFDATLNVAGVPDVLLLEDLKSLIVQADAEKPRSLQKIPGPSEVGHSCERRLAYGVNRARSSVPGAKGYNTNSDPLAAIMGTSMHAWLEDAAKAANARLGRTRWLTEQRVIVRPAEYKTLYTIEDLPLGSDKDRLALVREELAGTCDLYDFETRTVLDWKIPGATPYADYVKNGPSDQYRGQAHLYGAGYRRIGLPVEHVGIVFISRTGTLRQVHLWREPYNQDLVDSILARLDSVEDQMARFNVATDPSGFLRIDTTPGKYCRYCPWFSVNPQGPYQCKGNE